MTDQTGRTAHAVLAMCRLRVGIYPLRTTVSLREVTTIGKYLGGTAANTAVAGARYGRRAALLSRACGPAMPNEDEVEAKLREVVKA